MHIDDNDGPPADNRGCGYPVLLEGEDNEATPKNLSRRMESAQECGEVQTAVSGIALKAINGVRTYGRVFSLRLLS